MNHTTNLTLVRDLRASMALRNGVPVGVTWKGFCDAMRVLGVKDDDRIACIEFGVRQGAMGRIIREDAPDGIEIRER